MNTFQQQFLSVLGTAASSKLFKDDADNAGNADASLSKDKGAKTDAANEWSDEYENLSRRSARFLSGLELREIDRNKGDTAFKAFGELRDINKNQIKEIAGLKDANKHQAEEIAGLRAEMESRKAIQNRAAAKPHKMTDKEFAKEFYKRAKPIPYGGKK